MQVYITHIIRGEVARKLAKGKKRMCSGRQMGVSSYDQRGSSFFKLDRFLPNLVQLSPRNPSRIFSKICHGPVFANPLPRLKLGSSDANSSNVINHTADFWVALRRSRRFPILIILKIERYIFFYYICEEIVIILLQTIPSSLFDKCTYIIEKLMKRKSRDYCYYLVIVVSMKRLSRESNIQQNF